jgi:hypothetical protein
MRPIEIGKVVGKIVALVYNFFSLHLMTEGRGTFFEAGFLVRKLVTGDNFDKIALIWLIEIVFFV